jgi:hypothetical protein
VALLSQFTKASLFAVDNHSQLRRLVRTFRFKENTRCV